MSNDSNINTQAFYLNPQRKVAVLNYNEKYIADIFELLDSEELLEIVQAFLDRRSHKTETNHAF